LAAAANICEEAASSNGKKNKDRKDVLAAQDSIHSGEQTLEERSTRYKNDSQHLPINQSLQRGDSKQISDQTETGEYPPAEAMSQESEEQGDTQR